MPCDFLLLIDSPADSEWLEDEGVSPFCSVARLAVLSDGSCCVEPSLAGSKPSLAGFP